MVFVEKPLAINYKQLTTVIETRSLFHQSLMVGFNRRFAPVCKEVKKEFKNASEPFVINIRVNAGSIPKEHWIQQPEIGAGRIVGEMCHFIDLMQFFTDAEPVKVFAESINTANSKITTDDNIAIIVKFSDGSVGNLVYVANGDKSLPKESIEVFAAGKVAIINDFKEGLIFKNGKTTKLKSSGKGHKEEVEAFLNAIKEGKESPISFRSICLTTITTFKIQDSLFTGIPQDISIDV
jgi:polar amino acid transport system substrate-binding protein